MKSLFSFLAKIENRQKLALIVMGSSLVATLDAMTIALIVPILFLVIRPRGESLPEPLASWLGPMPETSTMYALGGGIIALIILKNVGLAASMWVQVQTGRTMALRLADRMMRGFLAAPMEFHFGRKSAQFTRSIRDLPFEICSGGWISYCSLIAEVVGVLSIVALLAIIQPIGMLGAGLFLGVLFWAHHVLVGPRQRRWATASAVELRKTYGLINDVYPNIKIVKTCQAEQIVDERFHAVMARSGILAARNRFVMIGQRPVSEVMMMGAALLILVAAMWNRDRAIEALPSLAAFGYAVFRLLPSANRIVGFIGEMRRVNVLVEEADEMLNATQAFIDAKKNGRHSTTIEFSKSLELRKLGYNYPGASVPALHDVDLQIEFGEVIGIAGASGAGKSTLVDILLGLLEPRQGEILLDGKPPRHDGPMRGTVGYVPQSNLMLDMSARENIAFGDHPHEVDEERLRIAIERASLTETIAGLPGGLNGSVGEHGSSLSGGQRQRFAIARALYNQPSLLVLDEATSDLDMKTEFEVSTAISALRGLRTIVMVAHRLHVLRACDRIVFMEHGSIAAVGDHEALMKGCTGYREMVEMTAKYDPGKIVQETH